MKEKRGLIFFLVACAIFMVVNINSQYLIDAIEMLAYKPLQGATIVLDAGHGGKDSGARAEKVFEKDLNLMITLKCQKLLEKAGASVILTRDEDVDLSSDYARNHKQEDMKNRMTLINNEKNDILISIHLNSYGNTSVKGAQSFYTKDNAASLALAKSIQSYFKSELKSKMLPKPGDYYLLNETSIPGVLLECGFLSNPSERKLLQEKNYQDKIAEAIFAGVLQYFNELNFD